MPPVILSITPADPGYVVAVVSVAPGRRVQLVVVDEEVTRPGFAATLAALATTADRKGIQ